MATHSSILAWRIPLTGCPRAWWTIDHGVAKSWTQLKGLSITQSLSPFIPVVKETLFLSFASTPLPQTLWPASHSYPGILVASSFLNFGKIPWRRAWQCTSVFLEPGGLQSAGTEVTSH